MELVKNSRYEILTTNLVDGKEDFGSFNRRLHGLRRENQQNTMYEILTTNLIDGKENFG